ncbi:MAG TPA: protease pro-enzyme activation domain-containing protein, partial [Terriglobales bacterium]|nr:protease pro-enzyme activation domain-containing protein [Terriglobales bacterium]
MAFDKYVKVKGSERKPVEGATQTGAADPNEVMHVTVALRPRKSGKKPASLEQLVARGERLSRAEFEQQYGADPADVHKVQAFAGHFGLAVARTDLSARTVTLTGKASGFARAFQVELARYEDAGGSYRGRTGAVSVPQELSGIVVGVHGLDNRPQAKPHFRVKGHVQPQAAAASVSYSTLQIAQAYSFPANLNGSGQTIGIIELGGGYNQSDLDTYFQGLNISPGPTVVAVSVDGAQNQPT